MNKSVATNLIALALCMVGYFTPVYGEPILMTGLFALSGGVTNWLAVYMLFEKVPFLYGSGVIPNQFEEFKAGIKRLIVQEFFTRQHIERFLTQNSETSLSALTDQIDFDHVFAELTDAIAESPLGGMLAMVGGKKALEPLKEPVTEKLKSIIAELAANNQTGDRQSDVTAMLINQVEQIIDSRLAELTPEKVKEIVQEMIRSHLGWLVVWGGVFGGLIGLVVTLVQSAK
ncbi:MAG: hypothetical protein KDE47_09480 [Caldilineaceae bacterium]|nr:hypothetical protein [Caldilineaceae bacterium]